MERGNLEGKRGGTWPLNSVERSPEELAFKPPISYIYRIGRKQQSDALVR